MSLSPLESRLHYKFRNTELLQQAMTHRSYSITHNERLEFLGDSILNCVVAAILFKRFIRLDEGDLSRMRANLVKEQSLYRIAQTLNISEALRLGEGEFRSGGFRRPSILADAFEALLGAIFLDGGFYQVQLVIQRLYAPILDQIDLHTLGKDAKTLLQEYLQSNKIALPRYAVIAISGAEHKQQFEVECVVPELDVHMCGTGVSRRAAEQTAASKALKEAITIIARRPLGKLKQPKKAEKFIANLAPNNTQPNDSRLNSVFNPRPVLSRKAKRLEKLAEQVMQAMQQANCDDKYASDVKSLNDAEVMHVTYTNKNLTAVKTLDVLLNTVAPAIPVTTAFNTPTKPLRVLHETPDIESHLPHKTDTST
ncbi:ribonuclease III [Candidatus Vallotia tarda]|uniref:Ribonuclease 3 n=1 Tax=Candidatus Vallotiella hemipterorum TaxID=1177213 RepID=A0A916JTU8_9BURK|nr:ribonuclease III [Candidatus Vallotia tarda]CAG7598642.1 Ribonuclease 3 [Candidatus Vallotia tarda]